ncbi:NAD-glutamate dehydrogenase [Rhodococcus sp. Z13]|uniref:NAD-glutamate dehydrogenase n=1 Tax=Rhodococcus sacchari TaxID=2962047 RepID=A0ACD4DHN8_9NOCA|nr:NAD-glutamate dehydrogenase [Rhodococcus sp. Z13]UYP19541.1 NAD-glutamate dehydrogenase [Rhodococcus sp. Z13]
MTTTLHTQPVSLPDGYVEHRVRCPIPEVSILQKLTSGALDVHLDSDGDRLRFTLYSGGADVSLERVLHRLRSLDLEPVDHQHTVVQRPDGLLCHLSGFVVARGPLAAAARNDLDPGAVVETFRAMWSGRAESDGFAVLVLTAGLSWREVVILRAYAQFLRQSTLPYGRKRIETVLTSHPDIAAALVALFHAHFDPTLSDDRPALVDERRRVVRELVDEVEGLDADRIFRAYLDAIEATDRTNFHRPGALGSERPQLSFKLRSQDIPVLPEPRPQHEIFVYSPDVEGVHLRFGAVARGGIRWSDRFDDFRTEILGLAKAQAVKNAVIVPTGAKGGFVVKNTAISGEAGYRQFISGLLDITDNRTGRGDAVHPDAVVCRDGEDPYLVVAADKGTASFSDTANDVAADYGFWLGDAFASGGSVGYDHKAMGITARGAWVSVTRHLAEAGIDPDRSTFTVVGIGDMSGDVFGNGMLLSRNIRLVAAFDHRHVFLDPDPDPEASYRERQRLFELPRSSWNDYDRTLISAGGGVFERTAKSIPVTLQVAEALGLDPQVERLSPHELVGAVLRAPVDVLWNGGIGTYVKSSSETHAEVGDKANDAVRVDADQIRARVVGEGGNLGFTPLGRIEFARAGGRINTDALDNSAGVDCSDHEVNIKVLLSTVCGSDLAGERRAQTLARLTDEVAELVLENNRAQNRILGDARSNAAQLLAVHERMVEDLERRRGLDRTLESLPESEGFDELARTGRGLTSPELATLLAHAKLDFKRELAASGEFTDTWFDTRLAAYFPEALRTLGPIDDFPLRDQIIATEITNDIFARGGLTFVFRLREETNANAADIVRAFVVTSEVFGLEQLWADIENAQLPPAVEYELASEARRLLDRASRWFLTRRPQPLSVSSSIGRFRMVGEAAGQIAHWLQGAEAERLRATVARYVEAGVDPSIAQRVAEGLYRFSLLDIFEIAKETRHDIATVGRIYFALSEHLDVDTWLIRVSALPREKRWQSLARSALRDDLYRSLRHLSRDVVGTIRSDDSPQAAIVDWEELNRTRLERIRLILDEVDGTPDPDLAAMTVVTRQIRSVAGPFMI